MFNEILKSIALQANGIPSEIEYDDQGNGVIKVKTTVSAPRTFNGTAEEFSQLPPEQQDKFVKMQEHIDNYNIRNRNIPGEEGEFKRLQEEAMPVFTAMAEQTPPPDIRTFPGLVVGATSATLGAPADIAGLIGGGLYGIYKAAFPNEDETRLQSAASGFANVLGTVSETAGSMAARNLFDSWLNTIPLDEETKGKISEGADLGEWFGIPGAGTAVAVGKKSVMKGVKELGDFVAGAPARVAARQADTAVQLNAGVDVPAAIDDAIVGAQKLMGKTEDIVAAPETARAHRTPAPLLIQGSGEKPTTPVVQKFTKGKEQEVITNIDTALQNNPDAVKTIDGWKAFTQQTFGGDYLPHPPVVAMKYAQSPEAIAEKLNALTPELKAGVDEGFGYVKNIRNIYQSGEADPTMTADLFVWGILSRGAGPVQQEAAFIDIMEDAAPLIQKVADGTFDEADMNFWIDNMKKSLPEGSPSKQVTMNVNATGKLLFELSKKPQGSNRTVLEIMHDMISDPDVPAKDIRRQFMTLTESAGIDNKVVSFILLVSGRDDVLVMDRIQGRHLWDDGKFGGANIYDGIGKNNEGLNGIFKGPRGLLVTEAMEDAMRPNIQSAYEMIGRPEDGTLGRFHWESWVIEGEQVVSHSTLQAIEKRTPRGFGVTEGKTDEYASGFRYIRGEAGPVQRYPLSDGSFVYMTPVQAKEFLSFVKNPKSGIVPKGFKVTERADVPWYERTEVNRQKLDEAARRFENATPEGELLPSPEGAE